MTVRFHDEDLVPILPEVLPPDGRPIVQGGHIIPLRERVMGFIAMTLSVGVISLAIYDPSHRGSFFTFATTFIAGYAGFEVGKRNNVS